MLLLCKPIVYNYMLDDLVVHYCLRLSGMKFFVLFLEAHYKQLYFLALQKVTPQI